MAQEAGCFLKKDHYDFSFLIASTARWRSTKPWVWDISEFILGEKCMTTSMNCYETLLHEEWDFCLSFHCSTPTTWYSAWHIGNKESSQLLEAAKGKGTDSPLEPPEWMQSHQHLDFNSIRLICYSSNKTLVQKVPWFLIHGEIADRLSRLETQQQVAGRVKRLPDSYVNNLTFL